MTRQSSPSLRRAYRAWVEDQIEDYKDSVSRADLLRIADEAADELRREQGDQYQLTELLLSNAVDRKIFKLLKLPGYRTWSSGRQKSHRPNLTD
ncbi:MAG: hypothetical protein GEU90_06910 [Gemmatimonas sp.]|nr:hypothetical protein [Gemmatimonas sp.]